jgi:hypothetical protein
VRVSLQSSQVGWPAKASSVLLLNESRPIGLMKAIGYIEDTTLETSSLWTVLCDLLEPHTCSFFPLVDSVWVLTASVPLFSYMDLMTTE